MKNYTETSESSDSEEEPNTFLNSEEFVPTEEDKEYKGWRHLIPFRRRPKDCRTMPLQYAGLFSFLTGFWQNNFLYQAYKKGVKKEDLYDMSWHDSAEYNYQVIKDLWEREVRNVGTQKASVANVIFQLIKWRLLVVAILCLIFNTLAIIRSAHFFHKLLDLMQSPRNNLNEEIFYFCLLVMCSVGRSLFLQASITTINIQAIRARSGVLSLVLQKIFQKKSSSIVIGETINLCANDGQRIYDAIRYSVYLFAYIPTIMGAAYIVFLLQLWGVFGFLVFCSLFPMQFLASRMVYKYRAEAIPITEHRVKLMSEIITAVKLVKMYAWEKSFTRKIHDVRYREKSSIQKSLIVQSILNAIPQVGPVFAASLTILIMTLTGNDITVVQAFVFISVLNAMRNPISSTPLALKAIAEGYHATLRIGELLRLEDQNIELSPISDSGNLVEIKNGYFGWQTETDIEPSDLNLSAKIKSKRFRTAKNRKFTSIQSKGLESQPLFQYDEEAEENNQKCTIVTLHDINLSLKEGSLVGVCGAVGSGKTSLIQAILGMMEKESGKIALDKTKSISYVPQQAWIMNATVKENILFGKKFNRKWYNKVVSACALLSDFDQLPAGDQTEIGERGINLSGGQKQRISMARAVYSGSDIILLDDPLSAVDAMVGQHIFQHCLKELLVNKTVLFVSHQLQFLVECDHIIVMKGGQITEEGTHEELMKRKNGEYSHLIHTFHNSGDEDVNRVDSREEKSEAKLSKYLENKQEGLPSHKTLLRKEEDLQQTEGKLTAEENLEKDHASLSSLYQYLQAGGGNGISLIIFLLIVLAVGTQAFLSYWLSLWTDAGSANTYYNLTVTVNGTNTTELILSDSILDNPDLGFYQAVYGGVLVFVVVFAFANASSFMMFCLKASTTLHDQVFEKLMSSPMRFFDVTPSGQILNRFSKDIDEADTLLPVLTDQFFKTAGFILTSIILITLAFPFFMLAVIPIFVILYLPYKFCKKGIQETKILDNATKSPIFSHIATMIHGLDTIKAYKMEKQFWLRFTKLQDKNSAALFLFDMALEWTSEKFDFISQLIVLATFIFAVVVPKGILSPGMAALSLAYAILIGDMMQSAVRLIVQCEARFTSVKRIMNYIGDLESEAPGIIEHRRPPTGWPEEGSIVFHEVNVRYREGLPLVLKNISFEVKPQEKIGIVGRTGSGKSSLALILFRIMELDGGSITIDGIDISTIGLEDLRSKLSIIPQDPVLFVGTVRYNLDPFNMYKDKDLWAALRKCHVKHTIKALAGQLDAPIVENGENFSVGERQLICMARALLRQSKILVLDEATAAIDTETDSLVQETIKEVFSDCTMLTIAHRLNTITNYDRILVLDQGQVIEFDTPSALLANENSVFSQMVAVQDSQKHAVQT